MEKPIKTIIVDDVKPVRLELKAMLKEYPVIDVIGDAGNAEQAFHLVSKYHPDLIILDIKLPGLSGFDILDRLKGDFKIIFISTFEEYKEKAMTYQPVDFILKPINKDKLRKAIARLRNLP